VLGDVVMALHYLRTGPDPYVWTSIVARRS
jgi:hypothetical protein